MTVLRPDGTPGKPIAGVDEPDGTKFSGKAWPQAAVAAQRAKRGRKERIETLMRLRSVWVFQPSDSSQPRAIENLWLQTTLKD